MAYSAISKMRDRNLELFGRDVGPALPALQDPDGTDMKAAALRFLHERCEGLLFDDEITREEEAGGIFAGDSLKPGQIPYNMEMDINRLCLERELERFIDSGNANDAYTVFFCFFEIYCGRYGRSRKMIDLLSEYESNGSALLMKHRDHYSHSDYVFALGLAIYESNAAFRTAFKRFYHFNTDENDKTADRRAAHFFLAYWGMTSLFHDIGYPFELPFEEVKTYFELSGTRQGGDTPYLIYSGMENLSRFNDEEKSHFQDLYHRTFHSLDELLAYVLTDHLGSVYGFSEGHLHDVIRKKATDPKRLGFKMDHAYFSAVRLYRELTDTPPGVSVLGKPHMDALAAILLHNNLFELSICFFKYKDPEKRKEPLRMEVFPLGYLLMLCDELQCWDRISYGRNTRREMHPISAGADLSGGGLRICYFYDREEADKAEAFEARYSDWEKNGENGDPPRLKEFGDMTKKEQRFLERIRSIVNLEKLPLTVCVGMKDVDRKGKQVYLSSSSFMHLYDFAAALNGRYAHQGQEEFIPAEQLEAEFDELSLEYKLSNMNQAKNFARYLDAVGSFYTDRAVDYDLLKEFSPEQLDTIAPMEHARWLEEKRNMGWQRGDDYLTVPTENLPFTAVGGEKEIRSMLREQFRQHILMMEGKPSFAEVREHYSRLAASEKEKDYMPLNSMMKLIRNFDGLRIYKMPW